MHLSFKFDETIKLREILLKGWSDTSRKLPVCNLQFLEEKYYDILYTFL